MQHTVHNMHLDICEDMVKVHSAVAQSQALYHQSLNATYYFVIENYYP